MPGRGRRGVRPGWQARPVVDDAPPAVDDLTYEQARDGLVDVVRRLEAGGLGLEESLALWERGEALARACDERLTGARRRLDARDVGAPAATEAAPHDD